MPTNLTLVKEKLWRAGSEMTTSSSDANIPLQKRMPADGQYERLNYKRFRSVEPGTDYSDVLAADHVQLSYSDKYKLI
jgi:hypothetical protein